MALLREIIQLLSEPPGSVVFHLVTLFALQAVFAIALSQWRQNRQNKQAAYTAWAAAGIFVARVVLMLVGLAVSNDTVKATAVLPPLEQTVHTVTAVFLVWALVPHPSRLPRLSDTLLLIGLILVGIMYIFFAQDWQNQVADNTVYNATLQASIWGIVQMLILGIGVVLLIANAELRNSLHIVILGLLLLAHVVHFWNFPEIIPTETNIAYWIRLGHLVVLPLWAVLTYQYAMSTPQRARTAVRAVAPGLLPTLNLYTQVIRSQKLNDLLPYATHMVRQMVSTVFVGLAVLDRHNDQQMKLTSYLSHNGEQEQRRWNLDLFDWPSFRLAFDQERGVELIPNGLGARQLYDLYDELQVGPFGTMLVQPLLVDKQRIGLLLLAKANGDTEWSHQERSTVSTIANYLAQAVANSQAYEAALSRLTLSTPAAEETAVAERLAVLEAERERLVADMDTLRSRLLQTEARAAKTRQQAYNLAATLEEIERTGQDERVAALEAELKALRESLTEAEEAMAMAAAGEGGLSSEWVMLTITRYSAQLEEAQARIQSLEARLAQGERGPIDEVIILLAEELRTPITSIAGYTDLILQENIGPVSSQQREFLQRIKANSGRISLLLDQIIQLMLLAEPAKSAGELSDLRQVIETAVTHIMGQVRDKNLQIDLDIHADLPPLAVNPQTLGQIMTNLLENACRSSGKNGRVAVRAQANTIYASSNNGHKEQLNFIHLEVRDSGGGIHLEDLPRTFAAQAQTEEPVIVGLGDTGAGMAVTQALIESNGGRIWVDTEPGVGSTFSILFPINQTEDRAV